MITTFINILYLYSKISGHLERVVVYVCVAKERSWAHMTMLDNLYFGNIHPCQQDIVRGSPTDKLLRLLCKNEESLTASLAEQQKEIFLKFKNCQDELLCLREREAFRAGFVLATRIMVEVMDGLEFVEDA